MTKPHVIDQSDDEYDPETDEKTAYALFGLAAYKANVLERSLLDTLRVSKVISGEIQGQRAFDDPKLLKATMGQLIRFSKPYVGAHPDVMNDLYESLKRRNYLIHHFWYEQIADMFSESGRANLCGGLKTDCRLFTRTNERLNERIYDPLLRALGITPEMVEAQYSKDHREAMTLYEPKPFTAEEESA
ncbi:hypothetical protein ABZS68_37800 [Streptomyces sp. NPDC005571]|uniref:hypothetical protein n=1 Tax=Streptomyces sp. NPDC005571 TaxID=3156888 RepID=UPI0033AFB7BB